MNIPKYHILNFRRNATIYRLIFTLAVILLCAGNVGAQSETDTDNEIEKNRKYLIEHLSFYYVENPNIETAKAYKLDNAAIAEGKAAGAFWTDPTMKPLADLVKALLCKLFQQGNPDTQGYAAKYLKILNKPVQVWLYNDDTSLETYPLEKYAPCTDLFGYVQPCASVFSREDVQSDFWAGYMHQGVENLFKNLNQQKAHHTLTDTAQAVTSTFLHMLMHTQDHSDIDAHAFHSCETNRWYEHEGEQHFYVEAAPNMTLAYQEGIAHSAGLGHNANEYGPAIKWHEENGYMLVETFPDSTEIDFADKAWLYKHIREVAGEGDSIPGMPNYRGYKIRDLPPKFIMHNEIVIGLILQSTQTWVQIDKALAKTQAEMADPYTSFHPLATLFKYLCEGGLPEGQTVLSAFDLPADAPKRYMMALAFTDYFTAYNAQTKAEFSEIFDDELPQPWIDLYWDTVMEKVRKATHSYENEDTANDEDTEEDDINNKIFEQNVRNFFKDWDAITEVLNLRMKKDS